MIELTVLTVGIRRPSTGRVVDQDEAMDMVAKLNDQARRGQLIRMVYPDGTQFRGRIVRARLEGKHVKMELEAAAPGD